MAIGIGRRQFIFALGITPVAWPLVARAQQPAMPVIGFLHAGSPEPNAHFLADFRQGLSEAGYVEGQNVTIEYRWAAGQLNRLPEMAADLVRRNVAVIATPLSTQATLAAKAATATIPIVFGSGGDPVALGLVASFSRPGGNVTGVSIMTGGLAGKRLGVLRELMPAATRFAVLGNSHNALTDETLKGLQANAGALGTHVDILYAGTDSEIEEAFTTAAQNHTDAVLIAPDEFFTSQIAQLATLSLRHAVPFNLCDPRVSPSRGLDELRAGFGERVSRDRQLYGPGPQRREAGRLAGFTADQIRDGHQSQDREVVWHCRPTDTARHR
jgi:putative ABC transport system substrate-binding protein